VRLTSEECQILAGILKKQNPSLTPEQIAQAITGLLASTQRQRLAWALESRERDRAAQKAYVEQLKRSQPKTQASTPAEIPQPAPIGPPDPILADLDHELEQQAMERWKENYKRTYLPIWKQKRA
jgi:hypothetical protein